MIPNVVRTRFAPSPTGFPHVGGIRTALFAWLFARHHGGRFILRIEDTDVARTVPGAVESIIEGLRWLGLDWDEGPGIAGDFGPYIQSQRLKLYHEAADRLIKEGKAYHCYCSPERLEKMRESQTLRKVPPGYDRRCRNLSAKERDQKISEGITPVVRFKMPLTGQTRFQDIVRGVVVFDNNLMDDFVLLKSDGFPTYHLANIVDDHAMEISHVIRAEEWLSSTPKHILLYTAMGFEQPEFAHLPLILGPDRSKLSKRHGAVSVLEYREQGYLPETMINFLALLGWSLDDKTELFSKEQLIKDFSLERVSKTAAIFNIEKIKWMNGTYIRHLSTDDFTRRVMPILEANLPPEAMPIDVEYVKKVMPLVQDRTKLLVEVTELSKMFFMNELKYESTLLWKGMFEEDNRAVLHQILSEAPLERQSNPLDTGLGKPMILLEATRNVLKELHPFDHINLETVIRPMADKFDVKTKPFFGLLRVAITGQTISPPLFQTMEVLGKERCLARISTSIEKLKAFQA